MSKQSARKKRRRKEKKREEAGIEAPSFKKTAHKTAEEEERDKLFETGLDRSLRGSL